MREQIKKLVLFCTMLIVVLFWVRYGNDILLDLAPAHKDPLLPRANSFTLAEYNCKIKIYLRTFDGNNPYETLLNKDIKGLVLLVGATRSSAPEAPEHLSTKHLRQLLLDRINELYLPFIAPRGVDCPKPDIVIDPKDIAETETKKKILSPAYITIDITLRPQIVSGVSLMLIQKKYFRPGLTDQDARDFAQTHTGSLIIPFDMPRSEAEEKINDFLARDMFFGVWAATID